MSDIKRVNPVYEPAEAGSPRAEPRGEAEQTFTPPAKKKSGFWTKLLVVIIIIVAILIGLFLVSKYTNWNILNVNKESATATGWQAVFLTNGQVYFGKIAKQNDKLLVLKDIYYLQVAQSPQPATEGQQQQQNLSLVKLGNELHGPKDEMRINMQQVLFTESMKTDSRVVDAIVRYMEEQK